MGLSKVAIFTHSIGDGSGPFGKLSTALARGMEEQGIRCDVVALRVTEEERQRFSPLSIVSLGAKRTSLSVGPLVRYLRQAQPQILYPMPWYFNLVALIGRGIARSRTKVILGEHNIISLEAEVEFRQKLHLRYLPVAMRIAYPFSEGLIGVCQDTITDLVEQLKISSKIPMVAIPNPIDLERIQAMAAEPTQHPWFASPEVPVILSVARLARQKQIDQLLQAFAQVLRVRPARLVIFGNGPLRAELEALCQALGISEHVQMPGFEANPYRYMAACAAFVLASAWEGCPLALEEALACGAPAIVNDAPGGSKEVVEHGVSGLVVPQNNPTALAEAMLQILSDGQLQQQLRHRALLRARDFHYLTISRQYLEFGESVG